MPITINHEPSFLVTGDYAYRAAKQQAQNRVAGQQAAAAQKDADRQAQVTNNILDNQAAIQKAREDAQADFLKQQDANEFKALESQRRNEWLNQRTVMKDQTDREMQTEKLDRADQVATTKVMDTAAKDVHKVLNSPNLNEAGKVQAAKRMAEYRAIQQQRAKLPPAAYNQAIGQWLANVDGDGFEDLVKPQPTPQEEFEANTYYDPKTGITWSIRTDKDGNKTYTPAHNPADDKGGKGGKPSVPSAEELFGDKEHYEPAYKDAEKALVTEKEAEAMKNPPTDGSKPAPAKPPTPDEVHARMREDHKKRIEREKSRVKAEADAKITGLSDLGRGAFSHVAGKAANAAVEATFGGGGEPAPENAPAGAPPAPQGAPQPQAPVNQPAPAPAPQPAPVAPRQPTMVEQTDDSLPPEPVDGEPRTTPNWQRPGAVESGSEPRTTPNWQPAPQGPSGSVPQPDPAKPQFEQPKSEGVTSTANSQGGVADVAKTAPKDSPTEAQDSVKVLEGIVATNGWDSSKWTPEQVKQAEKVSGNLPAVLSGLHNYREKKHKPARFFKHFITDGKLQVGMVYTGVVGPDGVERTMIFDGDGFIEVDGE